MDELGIIIRSLIDHSKIESDEVKEDFVTNFFTMFISIISRKAKSNASPEMAAKLEKMNQSEDVNIEEFTQEIYEIVKDFPEEKLNETVIMATRYAVYASIDVLLATKMIDLAGVKGFTGDFMDSKSNGKS